MPIFGWGCARNVAGFTRPATLTFLLLAGCFLWVAPAQAQTCLVPDDRPTIQSAVDDAGCAIVELTIDAATGSYEENVVIDRDVEIVGAAGRSRVVGGEPQIIFGVVLGDGDTVFRIESGGHQVELRDLIITGGIAENGGGVYNEGGDVEIHSCTIENNHATGSTFSEGGGVYNLGAGSIRVFESVIRDNTAQFSGGGLTNSGFEGTNLPGSLEEILEAIDDFISGVGAVGFARMQIENSFIYSNSAKNLGGGVHSDTGLLAISGSQINLNSASGLIAAFGGGVSNLAGGLAITETSIGANIAESDSFKAAGGGINNTAGIANLIDVDIVGNSAVTGVVGSSGGGINNTGGPAGTLPGLLVVEDSFISGNRSGGGGGIDNDGGSSLTVRRTTIRFNEVEGTVSAFGGGIKNSNGTALIEDSTIAHNRTIGFGLGAGIYVKGSSDLLETEVVVRNSTISGNNVTDNGIDGGRGGALYSETGPAALRPPTVRIESSTITANQASDVATAFFWGTGAGSEFEVGNSIVDGTCASGNGDFDSLDFNLMTAANCALAGPNDAVVPVVAHLELGPLSFNGGPTRTHALGATSVAIDYGGSCPPADQRGLSRPQAAACDIGAVEFGELPNFTMQTFTPGHLDTGVGTDPVVDLEFNETPGTASADDAFVVHSDQRGRLQGTYSVEPTDVLRFDPDPPALAVGDRVRVTVGPDLESVGGLPITNPRQWQFTVGGVPACRAGWVDLGLPGPGAGGAGNHVQVTAEWGDYDGDGDLDLIASGFSGGGIEVFRNDPGNLLVPVASGLPSFTEADADWGDFDDDGDLDIAINGLVFGTPTTEIYENVGGDAFVGIGAELPGTSRGSVEWGDFDDDGDLDLLFTGHDGSFGGITELRENSNGSFLPTGDGMTDIWWGFGRFADIDGDGDLDVLLSGLQGFFNDVVRLYRNDDGDLESMTAPFPPGRLGDADFGDFDNDGDLDLLLSSWDGIPSTDIWLNDGLGVFTATSAGLAGLWQGDVEWGDLDNDGLLDFMVTGIADAGGVSGDAFRNLGGGVFESFGPGFLPIEGAADFGDFDGDGFLDLILNGESSTPRILTSGSCLVDDAYAGVTNQDVVVTAPGVLDNDLLPVPPVSLEVVAPPSFGSVVLQNDGSFVYMPDPNYEDIDTFTYRAIGPGGPIEPAATVTITLGPEPGLCKATRDDGIFVFTSADATAVQQAGDLVAPGDVLEIAGTCVGVSTRDGDTQTLFLEVSGDVEIRGGYSGTDWTTPDPELFPTSLDAAGLGRVVRLSNDLGRVEIHDLELIGGVTANNGGGISSQASTLRLENTIVRDSMAGAGGGGVAQNRSLSRLEMVSSRVLDNEATGEGGGIYMNGGTAFTIAETTVEGNHAGADGGGLHANTDIDIRTSTIASNSADVNGGGIYAHPSGSLMISNSTISRNTATNGGGIDATGSVVPDVNNITVAENSASGTGGNIRHASGFFASNSIIAAAVSGGSCSTQLSSNGYNLDDDGSCFIDGVNNDTTAPADLAPLHSNGGVTETHALLLSSPAINGANPGPGGSLCEITDQRGTARPLDAVCDIGAYESEPVDDCVARRFSSSDVFEAQDTQPNASAIQNLIDGADDGDIIRVRQGRCVEHGAANVVDIHKDIQLLGSYDAAFLTADPELTPTLLDGLGLRRVLRVQSGRTVEIDGFRVLNGSASDGAGLLNDRGTVTVRRTFFGNNQVSDDGGAIYNDARTSSSAFLSVIDSTFAENTAGDRGGAIANQPIIWSEFSDRGDAVLEVRDSTFRGNVAATTGGAIANGVSLLVEGSVFEENLAFDGGAIHSGEVGNGTACTVTVRSSEFLDNRANSGGGFSQTHSRVFSSVVSTVIEDSIFEGNVSDTNEFSGSGLAFFPGGGGLYNEESELTVRRSTFRENVAKQTGSGGLRLTLGGDVRIEQSLVVDNRAEGINSDGGGITVNGQTNSGRTGNVAVINSTISGNSADLGAGIMVFFSGHLNLIGSTVTANSSSSGVAGLQVYISSDATIEDSILFGNLSSNTNRDCFVSTGTSTLTSNSGNLIGASTTCPVVAGDQPIGTNPQLGPLTDNGGPTETHALLAGSPAINSSDCSSTITPPAPEPPIGEARVEDQRGAARPDPNPGNCDIGAFEFHDGPVFAGGTSTVVTSSASPSVYGQAVTFTAVVGAVDGTPSGDVEFTIGAQPPITVPLDAAGVAEITTSSLVPGAHSVLAAYQGNGAVHLPSSFALTQQVDRAATTLVITSTLPSPSDLGSPVGVDLALAVQPPGVGIPSGTITVSDGTDGCMSSLPTIACTWTPTTLGLRILGADYSGDTFFEPASAAPFDHLVRDLQANVEVSVSGPTSTIAGSGAGNVTYQVEVTNNGPAPATGVQLISELTVPLEVTLDSITPGAGTTFAPPNGAAGVWDVGNLAAGASAFLDLVLTVGAAADPADVLGGSWLVAAVDQIDPNEDDDTASLITEIETASSLLLTKTDSSDPAVAGTSLTYELTITNAGPSDAGGLTAEDLLPAGISFAAGTSDIRCDQPPTLVGLRAHLTGAETIPPSGSPRQADGVVVFDTLTGQLALGLHLDTAGDAVTDVSLRRSGDDGLVRSLFLPPALFDEDRPLRAEALLSVPEAAAIVVDGDHYLELSTGSGAELRGTLGVAASGPIRCGIDALAAGASETFSVTVDLAADLLDGSELVNIALATSQVPDPDAVDLGTATVTGKSVLESTLVDSEANLSITKIDAPDPVVAGEFLTYTVTVTNAGPSDATNVTVSDTLPPELSAATTAGCAEDPTGTPHCSLGTIAAGDSSAFTIQALVSASALSPLSNTATVAADPHDPDLNDNQTIAVTSVQTSADLLVTKTDSDDPATSGTELTYTLDVTNQGPSDALAITVLESPPAELVAMTTVGCAEDPAGVPTCSIGGLAAGASTTVTVTGTIAPQAIGSLTNRVDVASASTPDPFSDNNNAIETTDLAQLADLSVVKTDSNDPVIAGTSLTYELQIDNAGPSEAVNVVIDDLLPNGTTFDASSSDPRCDQPPTLVGLRAALTGAETMPPSGSLRRVSAAIVLDTVTDQLAVGLHLDSTGDPVIDISLRRSSDDSLVRTLVVPPAVFDENRPVRVETILSVAEAAAIVVAGDHYLELSTSAGTELRGTLEAASSPVRCQASSLAASGSDSFSVTVDVDASRADGSELENTALLTSAVPDPDAVDVGAVRVTGESVLETTAVETESDVSITKSDAPDPVVAGELLIYTVTVTNDGPSDAINVEVSEVLPMELGVATTSGCAEDPGGTPTCSLGTIAVGDSSVFTIQALVSPSALAPLTNTATASAAPHDPDLLNNQATAITTVQTSANLGVTKSDSVDPAVSGTELTYTLEIVNLGPSDAQSVALTEAPPTELTTISTIGCAEDPGGVPTCSLGTLAAGASTTVMVTGTIVPHAVGSLSNSVTVASASTPDPDEGDNTASETTDLTQVADLAIVKTDSNDPVVAGTQLTYDITVTNHGPSRATAVTAIDSLPPEVALVATTGCSEDPSGVPTCTLGALDPGASTSYSIVVSVDAATVDSFVNTVQTDSAASDSDPANNEDSEETSVGVEVDLSVTKADAQDPIPAGAPLTYTISVTNAGPSIATGIEVTEDLPAGVTFESTTGCANDPSGVPTCEVGFLIPGASTAVTIGVSVDASTPSGTITNTASVSGNGIELDPTDNTTSEDTLVDAEPPTVERIDTVSSTEDGVLEECEEVAVPISRLLVSFDEPVRDPPGDLNSDDVTNPDNYRLVAAGPDADFETSACNGPSGDDLVVPITAVTYDSTSHTANLSVDPAAASTDSLYRLLVCGSTTLRDIAGNPLDGDADGVGGDDFVRTYRVERSNLLRNGQFDCDLGSWIAIPEAFVHSDEDADSSSVSGSAEIINPMDDAAYSIGQCAPVGGERECLLTGRVRTDSPADTMHALELVCETFAANDCSGASLGASSVLSLIGESGGDWESFELPFATSTAARSALCSFDLTTLQGSALERSLDNARLRCDNGLFADDFESGDTSAWSTTVP